MGFISQWISSARSRVSSGVSRARTTTRRASTRARQTVSRARTRVRRTATRTKASVRAARKTVRRGIDIDRSKLAGKRGVVRARPKVTGRTIIKSALKRSKVTARGLLQEKVTDVREASAKMKSLIAESKKHRPTGIGGGMIVGASAILTKQPPQVFPKPGKDLTPAQKAYNMAIEANLTRSAGRGQDGLPLPTADKPLGGKRIGLDQPTYYSDAARTARGEIKPATTGYWEAGFGSQKTGKSGSGKQWVAGSIIGKTSTKPRGSPQDKLTVIHRETSPPPASLSAVGRIGAPPAISPSLVSTGTKKKGGYWQSSQTFKEQREEIGLLGALGERQKALGATYIPSLSEISEKGAEFREAQPEIAGKVHGGFSSFAGAVTKPFTKEQQTFVGSVATGAFKTVREKPIQLAAEVGAGAALGPALRGVSVGAKALEARRLAIAAGTGRKAIIAQKAGVITSLTGRIGGVASKKIPLTKVTVGEAGLVGLPSAIGAIEYAGIKGDTPQQLAQRRGEFIGSGITHAGAFAAGAGMSPTIVKGTQRIAGKADEFGRTIKGTRELGYKEARATAKRDVAFDVEMKRLKQAQVHEATTQTAKQKAMDAEFDVEMKRLKSIQDESVVGRTIRETKEARAFAAETKKLKKIETKRQKTTQEVADDLFDEELKRLKTEKVIQVPKPIKTVIEKKRFDVELEYMRKHGGSTRAEVKAFETEIKRLREVEKLEKTTVTFQQKQWIGDRDDVILPEQPKKTPTKRLRKSDTKDSLFAEDVPPKTTRPPKQKVVEPPKATQVQKVRTPQKTKKKTKWVDAEATERGSLYEQSLRRRRGSLLDEDTIALTLPIGQQAPSTKQRDVSNAILFTSPSIRERTTIGFDIGTQLSSKQRDSVLFAPMIKPITDARTRISTTTAPIVISPVKTFVDTPPSRRTTTVPQTTTTTQPIKTTKVPPPIPPYIPPPIIPFGIPSGGAAAAPTPTRKRGTQEFRKNPIASLFEDVAPEKKRKGKKEKKPESFSDMLAGAQMPTMITFGTKNTTKKRKK
ncbi:MAG: hypothetical protein KAJ03_07305 [Gammaproteobacteria bacterium]|nr:hypothetical protein [Gammaproteobacteria bacterium]